MRHILLLGFVAFALTACGDKKGAGTLDCVATGETCTDDAGCCTGNCDDLTGTCTRVPGQCLMADASCSVGPDCCSFSCIDFKCSGNQCTSDAGACSQDGECCSGVCGDAGTCTPLNAACKTSGNACQGNGECCSGLCKDGLCNNAPSFCSQTGDSCVTDGECCGGFCQIADGQTLGLCAVVPSSGGGSCTNAGGDSARKAPRTTIRRKNTLPTCGGECCSKACFPYGPTGVLVCQPPSGCHPTGELCQTDDDCCGGGSNPDAGQARVMCRKEPGFTTGRCDNGNQCAPAGDICRLATTSCNDTDRCCAGTVQTFPEVCRQDALGIPRCGAGTTIDCTDPASHAGQTCASSADCCGLPCVAIPGSETFVCGATCVPTTGACTTNTDCCSGLPCVIPGGQSQGTCGTTQGCAAYGQSCDANNPCCDALMCNGEGKCDAVIIL